MALIHDVRDVAYGDHGAPLLPELTQDVALGRDDAQRYLGTVVREAFERGQGRAKQGQHEGAEQAANDAKAQQDGPDVEEPPP